MVKKFFSVFKIADFIANNSLSRKAIFDFDVEGPADRRSRTSETENSKMIALQKQD